MRENFLPIFVMFIVVASGFMCGAITFDVGPAPNVPNFYEKISAKISYVNLVQDSKGNTYYMFYENGKEVKIKKQ